MSDSFMLDGEAVRGLQAGPVFSITPVFRVSFIDLLMVFVIAAFVSSFPSGVPKYSKSPVCINFPIQVPAMFSFFFKDFLYYIFKI